MGERIDGSHPRKDRGLERTLERYSICFEGFWVSRRTAIEVREIVGKGTEGHSEPPALRELRVQRALGKGRPASLPFGGTDDRHAQCPVP